MGHLTQVLVMIGIIIFSFLFHFIQYSLLGRPV